MSQLLREVQVGLLDVVQTCVSVYKSGNISEMRKDGGKVTMESL